MHKINMVRTLFTSQHLGCAKSDVVQIPAFEWLQYVGVRATEDANLTGDDSGITNDLALL
jgi:hypothetical protein